MISTSLHAAVLLWAVVSFTGKTFEVTPAESLPVDLVSEKDFSEMTKGAKQAPKAEKPKPLVEKKDEPKPVEQQAPKVTEKKEIAPTAEKTPEPQPLPPKRPERKQPKFDADKIAALLDKRDPQRNAATGAELNAAPSMGAASGNAARLSQSEIDALRARLMALWNPPIGVRDVDVQITIRIRFKRDGTLEIGPQVMTSGSGDRFNAMRDSAVRAVLVGQPYTMLRPDHYDNWKEIDFVFDTKEMFRDIPTR